MNLLAYQPKTAASQSVEVLIGKIGDAGDQWKALGTALTISFKEAYKLHEKTLKEVEARFKTENSYLMYYLFAAFVAGAVGGATGILIAPIMGKAAQAVANRMTSRVGKRFAEKGWANQVIKQIKREERARTLPQKAAELTVKGTEEVGVKAVEKLEIDKFLAAADESSAPDGTDIFKPAQTDPHQFDLDRRHEIDLCVSHLKEYVKRFQITADNFQWDGGAARAFAEMMIAEEFIQKQPGKNEIEAAARREKQNLAELGMWIAWAKGRNFDYWKIRLNAVREIDRGADYIDYQELRNLDPIVERLEELKVANLTTTPFKVTDSAFTRLVRDREPVLNIPALAGLGSVLGDPFLRRVNTIVDRKIKPQDWVKF